MNLALPFYIPSLSHRIGFLIATLTVRFSLDTVLPQSAELVSYRLEIDAGGLSDTVIGADSLRN